MRVVTDRQSTRRSSNEIRRADPKVECYSIKRDIDHHPFRQAASKLAAAVGIVSGIVHPAGPVGEEVISNFTEERMEAPPGFEPGMEVLQTSALPLGDGAARTQADRRRGLSSRTRGCGRTHPRREDGAGNGIRTRDFDLGKVALYH